MSRAHLALASSSPRPRRAARAAQLGIDLSAPEGGEEAGPEEEGARQEEPGAKRRRSRQKPRAEAPRAAPAPAARRGAAVEPLPGEPAGAARERAAAAQPDARRAPSAPGGEPPGLTLAPLDPKASAAAKERLAAAKRLLDEKATETAALAFDGILRDPKLADGARRGALPARQGARADGPPPLRPRRVRRDPRSRPARLALLPLRDGVALLRRPQARERAAGAGARRAPRRARLPARLRGSLPLPPREVRVRARPRARRGGAHDEARRGVRARRAGSSRSCARRRAASPAVESDGPPPPAGRATSSRRRASSTGSCAFAQGDDAARGRGVQGRRAAHEPEARRADPDPELRELAFLQLARIHYQNRQNRYAILYYGKMPLGRRALARGALGGLVRALPHRRLREGARQPPHAPVAVLPGGVLPRVVRPRGRSSTTRTAATRRRARSSTRSRASYEPVYDELAAHHREAADAGRVLRAHRVRAARAERRGDAPHPEARLHRSEHPPARRVDRRARAGARRAASAAAGAEFRAVGAREGARREAPRRPRRASSRRPGSARAASSSTSATASGRCSPRRSGSRIEVSRKEREALEGALAKGSQVDVVPRPQVLDRRLRRAPLLALRGRVLARRARHVLVHAHEGLQGPPARIPRGRPASPGAGAPSMRRALVAGRRPGDRRRHPRCGSAARHQRRPAARGRASAEKRAVAPDASLGGTLEKARPARRRPAAPPSTSRRSARPSRSQVSDKRREEIGSLRKLIELGGGTDARDAAVVLPARASCSGRSRSTSSSRRTGATTRSSRLGTRRPARRARLDGREAGPRGGVEAGSRTQALALYKAIVAKLPEVPAPRRGALLPRREPLEAATAAIPRRSRRTARSSSASRSRATSPTRGWRSASTTSSAANKRRPDREPASARSRRTGRPPSTRRARVYGVRALQAGVGPLQPRRSGTSALELFRAVIYFGELPTSTVPADKKLALVKEARKDYVRTYSHVGTAEAAAERVPARRRRERLVGHAPLARRPLLRRRQGPRRDPRLPPAHPGAAAVARGAAPPVAHRHLRRAAWAEGGGGPAGARLREDAARDRGVAGGCGREGQAGARRTRARDAEQTLRVLAVQYHNEWKKTRDEPVAGFAAAVYRDYLDVFPDEPTAYEMRFFHAELRYALADFEGAGAGLRARRRGSDVGAP